MIENTKRLLELQKIAYIILLGKINLVQFAISKDEDPLYHLLKFKIPAKIAKQFRVSVCKFCGPQRVCYEVSRIFWPNGLIVR